MKVTVDGITFTVVEESPSFYIASFGESYGCTVLEKSRVTIVPELPPQPVWKDVTAECEGNEKDGNGSQFVLRHNGQVILYGITDDPYRLTKISGPLTPHVAFIVEKQE